MIKIIVNNWLPRKPYAAMALGNRIFVRKDVTITQTLIAHELVHVQQYRDYGMIKFLAIWLWEFFTKGYKNIRFEVEAYKKESYPHYQDWARQVMEDNQL